jgi:uncharacterized protein (DUF2267 family)
MPLERFLARVAKREGVALAQASTDAPAVFTTPREADGDQECFDTTVQLPPEHAVLWAH